MMDTFINFEEYMKLYEGGMAFKKTPTKRFPQSKADLVESKIIDFLENTMGLDKSEYAFAGSFKKKTDDEKINDVDVLITNEKIRSLKDFEDMKKFFKRLTDKIRSKRILARNSIGVGVISVRLRIEVGKFLQVDLVPVKSLEWGKWSLYSPDFTKGESDYKGLYRNAIFEAVCKSIHFNVETYKEDLNDYIRQGDVKSYYRYRYYRNLGVYKVQEVQDGVRKLLYTKDKETYKFVTNNPKEVVELLMGKYKPSECMTFEQVWKIITSEKYKHKQLLGNILENYKIIIVDRQKNELPDIVKDFMSKEL